MGRDVHLRDARVVQISCIHRLERSLAARGWSHLMHPATIPTLLVVLLLRFCSPIDALNARAPSDGITVTRNVAYGEGVRRTLDVYAPRNRSAAAPVVVFFYGGGWHVGMKKWHYFIGAALAAHGVLVVIPDYRQYPDVQFPSFVEDAAAAVAWAHTNATRFGGDPNRLFLMGHSAGGEIVGLLALDPFYLRAVGLSPGVVCGVIGLAGAYDFHPLDPAAFGAIPPTDWPRSRPINYVTPQAPPMLLLAGLWDNVVEAGNTQRFADRLRTAGVPVDVQWYPGITHMAIMEALGEPLTFLAPTREAVLGFVAAHAACGRGSQ
jgi:acetyl esterase/lipase